MVFVRGGKKVKGNESFFKVTPLILAIEGQNDESYKGVWTFKKIPNLGRGSGEVEMVSYILPV